MTTDDRPTHPTGDDAAGDGAGDHRDTDAAGAPTDSTPTGSDNAAKAEPATTDPSDSTPAAPRAADPSDTALAATDVSADEPVTSAEPVAGPRTGGRRVAAWVLTALACLLVLFALVAPDQLSQFTSGAFVRIPVEGLVGIALLLALPPRPRRIVAIVIGVILGLLTVVKIIDMGFYVALDRPFDPVFDWAFFGPGLSFVKGSIGNVGAIAAVVGLALLVIAVVVLMALAVGRLTRLAAGHRTGSTRTIALLGVVWIVCAVTGVQIAPGQPIAARTAAALTYDDVRQVGIDIQDQKEFTKDEAIDQFKGVPGDQLLSGLRGKNVILTFVESYGRVATQDSSISAPIDALLDAGTKSLHAAGYDARSGFLTSSTVGGGSFLAHATLQSGLWVNTQQRYNELTSGNRLTLSDTFRNAGWRTVNDAPENGGPWPQGPFFGYQKIYDGFNVGYHGPKFSYAAIPDQYTMKTFQDKELAPGHPPVMAEIDLISSHSPWAPIPKMVPWNAVGNGSIYDPQPAEGTQASSILSSAAKLQVAYGQSIQYSLNTLISYVQNYGDKNLVLIFLGDHQPASIITGEGATHDVPITIVAKDPAVLAKISGWGWQDGLRPGPNAPVWRMDTFRDKFVTAFSK